ncbi:hypothetical protein [Dickeya dianthicola]|nr:hypothetical protein [Dickeya dianthicola]MBT1428392.1 hypothetical protein [Dickeya dianthicola]MBT1459910.1 hypothetical protein [Dickeya dianthicola]MBT1489108.1 hypothetical protein [Dickeya dianthicola]MCI4202621.1 hypothetical protein [Dickeya dianthicola]MCI4213563.1 hypothetical protein [Dickeya dianthicola]
MDNSILNISVAMKDSFITRASWKISIRPCLKTHSPIAAATVKNPEEC